MKGKGKGNRPWAAEPLTKDDEAALIENKCVGVNSPEQLLNKMWLSNTMLFGLRGGTENHNLRWGDIALRANEKGTGYLEFNERITKTRTGQAGSDQRAFRPKQFAHENKDDCPVNAYKEYSRHRPQGMCYPDAPFYLSINYNRTKDSAVWYKNQPLGENSLRGIMKKMAKKANIPGRKTNHTARKTTCTKLLHAGVEATTIQQLTGHKNVQSVNNYANASAEMQQHMSDILSNNEAQNNEPRNPLTPLALGNHATTAGSMPHYQNPLNAGQLCATPIFNSSAMTSTSANMSNQVSGQVLQNARLMNCHITVNHMYSQREEPKRRRIRVIESDTDSD